MQTYFSRSFTSAEVHLFITLHCNFLCDKFLVKLSHVPILHIFCHSCQNGRCVPKCRNHSDCPSEQFCQKGKCTNTCQRPRDCPVKKNYRRVCRKKQCYYIRIGCDTDRHCPKGHTCYKRRCIKTQCKSDKNCMKIGAHFTCVKGKCVETSTCRNHWECRRQHGKNFRCIKRICRKVKKIFRGFFGVFQNYHFFFRLPLVAKAKIPIAMKGFSATTIGVSR